MTASYRLPCECGAEITVTTNQCGTAVTCQCGRTLYVPSWRELAALQQVGGEQPPAEAAPSLTQTARWVITLQLIGLGLVVIAVIGGSLLLIYRPRLPDLYQAPPAFLYHYFKSLQQGISAVPFIERLYAQNRLLWSGLWDVVLAMGGIGILLGVSAILANWFEKRAALAAAEADAEVQADGESGSEQSEQGADSS